MPQTPYQINSYCRAVLVRAIDPLTRGKLLARMNTDHAHTAHMRSFLDPPTPRGHNIKGSGRVNFRPNRKNSKTQKLSFSLHRACDRAMSAKGVNTTYYTYGRMRVLDPSAIVSINGRRSVARAHLPRIILRYSYTLQVNLKV